ncbi:hypothetical protein NNL21_18815 [Paenibacillus mendelii]|nr:hypothetical protein [Paenibacillus mendelii]
MYDGFVSVPEGVNVTDKIKYEKEEMIKFVYGKRPVSEFGDFIQT